MADRAELYCLFESERLGEALTAQSNLQKYGDPFAKYQKFDVEGCELKAIRGEKQIPGQDWLRDYRKSAVADIADISEKLGQPTPILPEPAQPRNSIPRNAKPECLKHVNPEYTQAAADAHYRGTVHLRLKITARGAVASIQIIDPPGFGMEESILRTVAGWRFRPAIQDGDPAPSEIDAAITFERF